MVNVLEKWNVLLPEAVATFRKLENLRHKSIHFSTNTYSNLRNDTLSSLNYLDTIIDVQFSAFGLRPWFIEGTAGACFIKASYGNNPFIKKYYIPLCPLVGVYYRYSMDDGPVRVFDWRDYESKNITDEEFKDLFNNRSNEKLAPTVLPPSEDVTYWEWTWQRPLQKN